MSVNAYPAKPHFHIENLGFAGVYLIFSYFLSKKYIVFSLEQPQQGGSNVYPQFMF